MPSHPTLGPQRTGRKTVAQRQPIKRVGKQIALPNLTGQALAAAKTWRSIGGPLRKLAAAHDILPAAALAVWMVECGPLPFVRGRPVLRFECHKLFEHWGHEHAEVFDGHFRFGGRQGVEGAAWSNHQFRLDKDGEWQSFHGSQTDEYVAFNLAKKLAGHENAALSSSFGGPQILGSNYAKLGYGSAIALQSSFAARLRSQLQGFFDFCSSERLFPALRSRNWLAFAEVYNGPGKADSYAEKINDAYLLADAIVRKDARLLQLRCRAQDFAYKEFNDLVMTWGLRHFSAREFLFRGREHSDPAHPAYGLNSFPPKSVWGNLEPVAKAADRLRACLGKPIKLVSIYRTSAFNAVLGSTGANGHEEFSAIGMKCHETVPEAQQDQAIAEIRKGLVSDLKLIRAGAIIHVTRRS